MPEVGQTFFAEDRATWRRWLLQHHSSAREIWLLLYKKHVRERCVSYEEAVREALCFGWIDGILKRVDDRQHVIRFSPRRPGSAWSDSNKKRVAELIAEGRMTPAGLAVIATAKQSGRWDEPALRELPDELPADLTQALGRNRRAQKLWAELAPSHRRGWVHWILDAKRAETRRRRVRETVKRVAAGKKTGMD